MYIVTGGAGFIGSNIVRGLNEAGEDGILIVDSLADGEKYKNLVPLRFADYADKDDFIAALRAGKFDAAPVAAVLHQGACSDTMEYDGKFMLDNNYRYSRDLLDFCLRRGIPFIYASSASVYGPGRHGFREEPACEEPLNVYAFSKLLFDRYVRRVIGHAPAQIVGLRYFNVFGPQENHKGRMASVVCQLYRQLKKDGVMRLFGPSGGYGAGEQRRDFIYVKDAVKVNLFFLSHPAISGVFNCGTGKARPFNAIAAALARLAGSGRTEYIDFPPALEGRYQSFTEANLDRLLAAGYDGGFMPLEDAIADYWRYLEKWDGYLDPDVRG